ncbi:MAG: DUF1622 domain-containing protein [Actinomycetota bacterium]|nr:DUF1622 domain-containing protein [Actinomycetota bacterium]
MTYEEIMDVVVRSVEGGGVVVLLVGGLVSFYGYAQDMVDAESRSLAYPRLRRKLARVILLGLEVLLLADIIRTIVVEPTPSSVLVLGAIVIIRILLSFSLEVEIDGTWPWNKWRTHPQDHDTTPL